MELAPSLLRRGFFAERANNPFSRETAPEIAISQRTIQPCAELGCVGWNTLGQAGLDNCWGLLLRSGQRWITRTLLLAMARDARHDGDLGTADLLFAEAMRYFDEADRLVSRWRSFETRLDVEAPRR